MKLSQQYFDDLNFLILTCVSSYGPASDQDQLVVWYWMLIGQFYQIPWHLIKFSRGDLYNCPAVIGSHVNLCDNDYTQNDGKKTVNKMISGRNWLPTRNVKEEISESFFLCDGRWIDNDLIKKIFAALMCKIQSC